MADADAEIHLHSGGFARDAALLTDTVREAGALALSLFRTELKNWIKGASSPVSEADIAVNELIAGRLRSTSPDYGWLSEESADDEARLGKGLVWIVDPIDGTRAYLAGREDWCVSVALVKDGQPVLGAVFAPASDEFFFAEQGRGSRLNGASIQATSGTALDFSAHRRSEAARRAAQSRTRRNFASSTHRFAGASTMPCGRWQTRCGFCGRSKPRLGPCGGQFDRAGSEW